MGEVTRGAPVCIVDPDPDVRDALEILLRTTGREAASFTSLAEYLRGWLPRPSACLLIDPCPPAAPPPQPEEWRCLPPSLPVILIPGTLRPSPVPVPLPCIRVLPKPFSPAALLALLALVLGSIATAERATADREQPSDTQNPLRGFPDFVPRPRGR